MLVRILLIGLVSGLGMDPGAWNDLGRNLRTHYTWYATRHQEEIARARPGDESKGLRDEAVCDSAMSDTVACDTALAEADQMPAGLDAFVSEPVEVVTESTEPAPTALANLELEDEANFVTELAEISSPAPDSNLEAVSTPAVAAVEAISSPDIAFEAMVDEMAVNFAQELSAPAPSTAPQPMLAQAESTPPPDAESLVAPAADDVFDEYFGPNPELAELVMTGPETIAEPLVAIPAPTEETEQPTERLETAMRLTGQAVHAWLSLIQAPSVALESDVTIFSRQY